LHPNYLATTKVAILLATIALAFQKSITDLFGQWIQFDESLSHGLMIIAIFFYLLLQIFKTNPPIVKVSLTSTLLLAILSFCWYLAASININLLEQLLLPPIIFSVIMSLYGWRVALKAAPVIAFLIFSIPIWDHLTPLLVQLSSSTVMWAIEAVKIPALISGNSVTLTSGTIVIADGCSGLRYFVVALSLASYIVLVSKTTLKQKILLILATVALSLFVNWLRIFIIILVAEATDMQSSLVADHETFGWVLFGLVCIPLIYYTNRLPVSDPTGFNTHNNTHRGNTTVATALVLAACLLAIAVGPILYYSSSNALTAPVVGDWRAMGFQQATVSNTQTIQLPNSKLVIRKDLTVDNRAVTGVLVLNWQATSQENLAPYWPRPYQLQGWNLLESNTIEIDGAHAVVLQLQRKHLSSKACLAIQYSVGGFTSTNYSITKLLQLMTKLTGNNQFSATAVILDDQTQTCENVEGTIIKALEAMKEHRDSLITTTNSKT